MDLPAKASKKIQPLPIGVDDYKDLIDEGYIYVDKTLFIKEFWDYKSKVTLVTRPRRFGKSITLSMIRYFFEKTEHKCSKKYNQLTELCNSGNCYTYIFVTEING